MKTINLNRIFSVLFAGLGLASIYGIVFKGAWWHVGTLAICWIMFKAFRNADEDDPDHEDPYIEE